MKAFDSILSVLPERIRIPLQQIPAEQKRRIWEVRLREEKPVTLRTSFGSQFLLYGGILGQSAASAVCVTGEEVRSCLQNLCGGAVYAYQEQLRQGFLTAPGGHRVGLCGTAVLDHGSITAMRDITSLCFRLAREVPGCSALLADLLQHVPQMGLLLVGPPGSGKTTVLRDLARSLCQRRKTVVVLDERSELSGAHGTRLEFDLGDTCDVLIGYPKAAGISHAIRCLSPEYLLCDELADRADIEAIRAGTGAGVSVVATVHSGSRQEFFCRAISRQLLQTQAFRYLVFLDSDRQIHEILDLQDAEH